MDAQICNLWVSVSLQLMKRSDKSKLYPIPICLGIAVALWLECSTLDQVARVKAMAKVIHVLCSWASEQKN